VQHKNSRDPGDNQAMVEARRRFLDGGHYAPLARRLAGLAAERAPQRWLDIGCGEGYYTAQIADALPHADGYALDISREAIKRMSNPHGGQGGSIINLSSIAARLGAPGEYIDYAAAKGAIDSMTVGLAKEVAGEGIRVNAVRPGVIDTEIHASGGEPDRIERVKASVPMGRGGKAEEVAEAILWLASEHASYTTGALLDVSGGR